MVQALPQIQHLGKEPSDLKCSNQPKPENPVANGKAASLVRLLKTESLWAGKSFLSIEFTGDTLASWSEAGALNPCDVTQKATGNPQGCGGWALLDANQQSAIRNRATPSSRLVGQQKATEPDRGRPLLPPIRPGRHPHHQRGWKAS